MKMLGRTLLAAGLLLLVSPPALADAGGVSGRGERGQAVRIPAMLSNSERENYRAVFADLRAQNWGSAAGRLDGMRHGPLHDFARGMLYTMPGSPRVEREPLESLLARAPDLPQAADLARLAQLRGSEDLAELPQVQRLGWLGGQPRRQRPRPIRGDEAADRLEPQIQPLLVADQPYEAESLFNARRHELSPEARTAFQQRIAWVFFLNGNDREARRLAEEGARGTTEWAIHSNWVAGLAAWRMQDYDGAAAHFRTVAARSTDHELSAAGHYWGARADTAGGQPQRVQGQLQAAARLNETFYGLLAQSALALRQRPAELDAFSADDWRVISDIRNVRTAVALAEIGEDSLAGDVLRHQARIGNPRQHEALLHLASRLNLTAAQMWLAHNGPRGARADTHDRYPSPSWQPNRGWRVDQALVFAHALQESNFRPDAVSPAGARGLMQVMPGTANQMARARGETANIAQLNHPGVNMEYGQTYLEWLRDQPGTGGLLPRVIAAYNAGPRPISEWAVRFDQSDPLLFIESIPYWETRGYVPIVLRNYWVYEERAADASPSRRALAAGLWPRFPGMPGPTAVRIDSRRGQTAMGQD
ncbi:lytic transglycosylase domain-containing protein [Sphingosinicella sp. CPCC 101087]|uniref:lytic transglycosylase domain-containing protein n=1 Tax=Sphingosinicella sp. CPCC 101087 TaxID=2497754 RepID=UPI00101CA65B|nr:lytic transglycosylase domain-containing protein [Sphingosinicella sp. CPCC 101087]